MLEDKKYFLRYMIILAMMSSMGLLASDIYIPAMPYLVNKLNTTQSMLQLTLGIYLFCLAVSQIFIGFLSDIYGRRKVLLVGFILYTFASLGCSLSYSIDSLIIFRFFQAIGASAGLVVGRATISDQFDLSESAKIYSIIYPIVAVSPAIAPLIGGYLSSFLGWQYTFGFVFVFGVVLIVLTYLFLAETNKNKANKKIFHIFNDYPTLLRDKRFLSFVIPVCLLYGTWFTYLSQSTFLFKQINYSEHTVGYFYIPLTIMIFLGNILNKYLISKGIRTERVFYIGLMFFLSGGIIFILIRIFQDFNSAYEIIVPMSIVSVSNGIVLPLGIASAINIFKEKSGVASGLVGFMQIGFSAICASFIGKLFGINFTVLATTILLMSVLSILIYTLMKE